MLKGFCFQALTELDSKLSEHTSHGRFDPKPILLALKERGFETCYFFDAAEDQVDTDYLLILSSYIDEHLHEGIIGRSIKYKESAIERLEGTDDGIVVVDAESEHCSNSSLCLAKELGVINKHRVHIPLFSDNSLVGAVTGAWEGDIDEVDREFRHSLQLLSVIIEKHILLSRDKYVQDKVGEIRSVFERGGRFDAVDKFLELGVELIRDAVNGEVAAFFDLNWYTGYLTKTQESFAREVKERLAESYKIGECLTGRAWREKSARYIVNFDGFKRSRDQEVDSTSEEYHKKTIGGVKTILYEKFGTGDREFLVRIFNRRDNFRLPFYISQKILLEQIAREFEFLLNDIILKKRLSDIREVYRIALNDITQSETAFNAAFEKLEDDWVREGVFVAYDKNAKVVTHCFSTIPKVNACVGKVFVEGERGFTQKLLGTAKSGLVRIGKEDDDEWAQSLRSEGVGGIYVVPFDSIYKRGVLGVCVDSDYLSGMDHITNHLPSSQVDVLRSYATIIGICVDAEESLLTSRSAKRLIGSIGHEVQGPIALAVGAANSAVQRVLEVLETIEDEAPELYREKGLQKAYEKLLDTESSIAVQSARVSIAMRLAKDVAEETKGGGELQVHFDEYSLYDVLRDAKIEVMETVTHIDAFDKNQRFVFDFNKACQSLKPMIGDKGLLLKVFINVFTNAVKYSLPPGRGRPIRIEVMGIPQTGQNIIQIKNFGMAIPPEERERIFLPFERGYTKDRLKARRGMGLGLYLARKIVLAHKGTIFLQRSTPKFDDRSRRSTEGWETVFEVRLPVGLKKGTYNYGYSD